jgi:hypothetical protein
MFKVGAIDPIRPRAFTMRFDRMIAFRASELQVAARGVQAHGSYGVPQSEGKINID